MKRLGLFFAWVMFTYISVAGFAWVWVLEIHYPFWKLLVVAGIQAVLSIMQFVLFAPRGKK